MKFKVILRLSRKIATGISRNFPVLLDIPEPFPMIPNWSTLDQMPQLFKKNKKTNKKNNKKTKNKKQNKIKKNHLPLLKLDYDGKGTDVRFTVE